MSRGELAGSFYDLVTGDEDARVCKDIPDAACNDQPQNFFLQLGATVCTKIGDELASAKLVLPWLLSAAGAPAFFIGLLVPIRESLSLLPQLFVAAATVAGMLSLAVAGWHMAGARGLPAEAVVVAAFFIIGVAHAGIRIGRKTYLVDMATAQTRATYVAVSNTAIGVVLLAGGVFGIVADRVGTTETIGLLGLFCLAGAIGATRLDEVTN